MNYENHLAFFYKNKNHQQQLFFPLLKKRMEEGQKIIYISNEETTSWIDQLFGEVNYQLKGSVRENQMKAWTAENVYLREGNLNFESMLKIIEREGKKAISEGFQGFFFCLEVTHILLKLYSLSSFRFFMSQLKEILKNGKTSITFFYDLGIIEAVSLMQVLTAHPFIAVQEEIIRNPYYTAPEENPARIFFSYLLENHEYLEKLKDLENQQLLSHQQFQSHITSIKGLEQEINSWKRTLSEKEEQSKNKETAITALEQKIKEEKKEKEIFLLNLQKAQEVINQKAKEIFEFTQEREALLTQKELREKDREESLKKETLLEIEIEQLKNAITEIESEKAELQEKLELLFQERKEEMLALEANHIQERIDWNEEKAVFEAKVGDSTQQILRENLAHEQAVLNHQSSIRALESELAEEKSHTIEKSIEIHRLESLIIEKEQGICRLQTLYSEMEERYNAERTAWKDRTGAFEQQLTAVVNENLMKENALKEATAINTQNISKIETFELELSIKATEYQGLLRDMQQLQWSMQKERERAQEVEKKYQEKEQQIEVLLREKEGLQNSLREEVLQKENSLKYGNDSKAQYEQAMQATQTLEMEKTGFVQKIDELTYEKEEYQKNFEDTRAKIKPLEDEILSFMEKEVEVAKKLQELEKEKQEISSKNLQLEELVERKKKFIVELKQKEEQSEEEKKTIEKEIEAERIKAKEAIITAAELKKKDQERSNQLEHIQVQLLQEENLFQEVQKEIFSYKAQLRIREDKVKEEQQKNADTETEIKNFKALFAIQEEDAKATRDQLRQVIEENRKLQSCITQNNSTFSSEKVELLQLLEEADKELKSNKNTIRENPS